MRSTQPRRLKAHISTIATNLIHLRNPWMTAWLSATFPGFGHLFLGSYLKGFLMIIWEIIININAKLNLAIVYSFTGQFDKAKYVLDKRWLLLYGSVYIYAIWDSYRSTVELNKLAVLTEREGTPISPFKISTWGIYYLDKRNPWVAAIWSALMPGMGHTYNHQLTTGFFVLVWWITITYFSHLLEAVHYTMVGDFSKATAVTDPQWLLFMPSIHLFAIYDAYVYAVESNKLFELEQARYLKANYQDQDFKMPI